MAFDAVHFLHGTWRTFCAWHLTQFTFCMAIDADCNRCHLTQINFTCQLTQNYVHGNWRRIFFFNLLFSIFFQFFQFFSFLQQSSVTYQIQIPPLTPTVFSHMYILFLFLNSIFFFRMTYSDSEQSLNYFDLIFCSVYVLQFCRNITSNITQSR